jgi:Arc/MetJ-type ribon-helix-helix transcriptional regulator
MQSVTIKLDDELAHLLDNSLKPYYSTKTEFIREAIRDKLQEHKREQLILKLKSLQGSSNKEPRELTPDDYEDMLKNILSGATSQKFRKYHTK